ncbi:MAG: CZB domain-containing protein [Marinosulfonomonas sp.]|nr:CZB domain-containing protein [Marinosulfonomonas sp.]
MSNENLIDQINTAITAHGSWKIKLRTAVNKGHSEHSVDDVRCDDKCPFGKWLHGPEIDDPTRASVPYTVIKRLHAEFHLCAADVLEMATTGNTNGATELLDGDFCSKSEKLVRGLCKWKGEATAS